MRRLVLAVLVWSYAIGAVFAAGPEVLLSPSTEVRYIVNGTDSEVDESWHAVAFDDSTWERGPLALGMERGEAVGAEALYRIDVGDDVSSVFCRARFDIDDPQRIENLFLGMEFDDGFIAWLNGVEIFRSSQMPAGDPAQQLLPK